MQKDAAVSRDSAKKDISKIVTNDTDMTQSLKKHLLDVGVAKDQSTSYTSTGIAPREENKSAEVKPSQSSSQPKKEATLDVLQDILSD